MRYLLPLFFTIAASADIVVLDKAKNQFIICWKSPNNILNMQLCKSLPPKEGGPARECRQTEAFANDYNVVSDLIRDALKIERNAPTLETVTKKIAELDYALKVERFIDDTEQRRELADKEKLQKVLLEFKRADDALANPDEELELSTETSEVAKTIALMVQQGPNIRVKDDRAKRQTGSGFTRYRLEKVAGNFYRARINNLNVVEYKLGDVNEYVFSIDGIVLFDYPDNESEQTFTDRMGITPYLNGDGTTEWLVSYTDGSGESRAMTFPTHQKAEDYIKVRSLQVYTARSPAMTRFMLDKENASIGRKADTKSEAKLPYTRYFVNEGPDKGWFYSATADRVISVNDLDVSRRVVKVRGMRFCDYPDPNSKQTAHPTGLSEFVSKDQNDSWMVNWLVRNEIEARFFSERKHALDYMKEHPELRFHDLKSL